nr:collagen alpha-1(II) chain [Oryctolagus cuniculus]
MGGDGCSGEGHGSLPYLETLRLEKGPRGLAAAASKRAEDRRQFGDEARSQAVGDRWEWTGHGWGSPTSPRAHRAALPGPLGPGDSGPEGDPEDSSRQRSCRFRRGVTEVCADERGPGRGRPGAAPSLGASAGGRSRAGAVPGRGRPAGGATRPPGPRGDRGQPGGVDAVPGLAVAVSRPAGAQDAVLEAGEHRGPARPRLLAALPPSALSCCSALTCPRPLAPNDAWRNHQGLKARAVLCVAMMAWRTALTSGRLWLSSARYNGQTTSCVSIGHWEEMQGSGAEEGQSAFP